MGRILQILIRVPIVKHAHLAAMRIASQSGFLASLWYLFAGAFHREHKTILSGRYLHKTGLREQQGMSDQSCESQLTESQRDAILYTLRRNTHRLEKGLIMKPRRDVFALDYVHETVSVYKALRKAGGEPATLAWAGDVLNEYFRVVDTANPSIAKAKHHFEVSEKSGSRNGTSVKRIPYQRDLNTPTGINIEDFHRLAQRRRSCRWFLDRSVPRELIDHAIEIGTQAPSACNRQPFRFVIFDKPSDAARIGALAGGTVGFAHNFPCLVALVGDFSAYPSERDRHLPYIDGSLAAMGFLFALEIQGLSSCCINWPDIESRERRITDELQLKDTDRVLMLIAIGYPDSDGSVPHSQKKELDSIRVYASC